MNNVCYNCTMIAICLSLVNRFCDQWQITYQGMQLVVNNIQSSESDSEHNIQAIDSSHAECAVSHQATRFWLIHVNGPIRTVAKAPKPPSCLIHEPTHPPLHSLHSTQTAWQYNHETNSLCIVVRKLALTGWPVNSVTSWDYLNYFPSSLPPCLKGR